MEWLSVRIVATLSFPQHAQLKKKTKEDLRQSRRGADAWPALTSAQEAPDPGRKLTGAPPFPLVCRQQRLAGTEEPGVTTQPEIICQLSGRHKFPSRNVPFLNYMQAFHPWWEWGWGAGWVCDKFCHFSSV